jgi:hypothetical protein
MQMQNATSQGIAGLMQKPPAPMMGQQSPGQTGGQPQMPSPNKASPMAGLGSVGDRVSAYQGNTKPLEQRYAMTQDLLDLLALQQIKSQKDAAARQMQLQMAQQQDQNGEASMTVAQQREKEVGDLTKNELAQQRGDTAQQQTQEQQAKMQKMMSGIAGAPGAASAAQPVAMAAGGIVGYAGPTGSLVSGAPEEKNPDMDEEGNPRPKSERDRIMAENARLREMKANAQTMTRMRDARMSGLQNAHNVATSGLPERIAEFDKPRRPEVTSAAQAVTTQGAPPTAPAAPAAVPPADKLPPANVVAAAQAAPKPAAPPVAPPGPAPGASANMVNPMTGAGLGSLPAAAGAVGAEGAPPAVGNFGQRMEAASLKNAEMDSAAEGLKTEKRVKGELALTPDQRKVYDEGIAGLQGMYKEQYDPERQQREGLKRALIGAGGRRYGEFAGAAEAGMGYDDQQRAAKLKEFGDIQNARTGLIGLDRGAVKEGITAGQKRSDDVSKQITSGLTSGANKYSSDVHGFTSLYNTDATERSKTLDREVEKAKNNIAAEANKLYRENSSMEKARTWLSATEIKLENTVKEMDKAFRTGPTGMLQLGDPSKLKPEEKNRLDIATAEHEKNVKEFKAKLQPVIDAAYKQLGVTTGGSAASPAQEAALNKYAPKAK